MMDTRFILLGLAAVFLSACGGDTPKPAGPFSIGAIADCQYADKEANGQRLYRRAPGKLEEAIGVLNEFDLEFVVHLGDFIEEDFESFAILNDITSTLSHPMRHIVGNHDYYVIDEKKSDVHKVLGMPDRYYSFEYGNYIFVAVDGNDLSYHGWPEGSDRHQESIKLHTEQYKDEFYWNGALGREQLEWFDKLLTRADRQGKRVVAFSHFPIYPDHDLNLWNAEDVLAMFESHPSATAWINGHNHDGGYGERNGVHYVTLSGMLDTERNSFSIIEFDENAMRLLGFGRQDNLELTLR
ncbi:MAG: metallophosphoesterase [Pseudomonadota bacterium]